MKNINTVTPQVARKDGSDAENLTFPSKWTSPRALIKLIVESLALRNVKRLVTDAEHVSKDLLICLLFVRFFGVDTKTLLEDQRDFSYGTDCNDIQVECLHEKEDGLVD